MAKKRRGSRGGRGFNGGRGGGKADERGKGRGHGGRGAPGSSFLQEELDLSTRMFADANNSGASTPRGNGRGRGRGGPVSGSNSGTHTPNRGRGRGFDSPRGRGRGQPDNFRNRRRSDGIGSSPTNRGRGGVQAMPGTLSGLLYLERPLLRPIVFVPSVLTKVLFEQEEELIKPGVEDVDGTEQSDLPTADRVYRVFSGGNFPRIESDNDGEEEDGEEIEEVDFNELGTLFEKISTTTNTTKTSKSKLAETTTIVEQSFTGFYHDTSSVHPPTTATDVDQLAELVEETLLPPAEPFNSEDSTMLALPNEEGPLPTTAPQPIIVDEPEPQPFHIDLEPTPVPATMAPENELPSALQNDDDDDDIIVYVAPHPRNTTQDIKPAPQAELTPTNAADTSLFTPYVSTVTMSAASASSSMYIPEPPSISSFSFSFSQSAQSGSGTPGKASARLYVPPITTPRQAKAWKRKRGLTNKKRRKSSFGAFGAMREEAQLHNDDPKRAERRRGDSDLDWGDTDDDDVPGVDVVEEGLEGILGSNKQRLDKGKGKERDVETVHGMEVDSDVDIAAMQSFVGSMLGADAGQHVTMDDIRDAEIMEMEDEQDLEDLEADDSDSSEDEDVENVFDAEEAKLISELLESDDDERDDDTDDDDDDDQTPRTSFQARLERLREKARSGKFPDSDEDGIISRNLTWADEDEIFIEKIQDMVDENEAVLTGKDRKQRNSLFRSIRDGTFEDLEEFNPAKRRRDKGKDLPPDLQAQWEKDRKAKAEQKKKREIARLEAAADPLSKKKGGKKGRKAMQAAAKLDPTINVIPNRVIDMVTLVQQIRRFIAEIGGPSTMSLPPTNKETRKNIHEMALAFNLKSQSKGYGDARYTTLWKTTKTGTFIDERKVDKIVRRSGGMGARGDSFISNKKGRGGPVVMPRHREGEEVGKAAPKIAEGNVGFRLLSMMGWSEGGSIGFTGGLDQPLTAIIKHTKLGLGATK